MPRSVGLGEMSGRGSNGDILLRIPHSHPHFGGAIAGGTPTLTWRGGESLVRFDHFWAKAKLISGRLITGYAPNQCAPQFSLVVPNPIIATGVTASSEVPQSS
jgi:hypothetical protein